MTTASKSLRRTRAKAEAAAAESGVHGYDWADDEGTHHVRHVGIIVGFR